MAFDTPNGTRGARQPGRSRLERWGNQRMVESLRRKGDRRGEKLVLVTVGRKSGTERMTPVRWFPDGDARLIVASASGAPRNPSWYYNMAAHPDRVRIEFAGQRIKTTARGFARYERVTDRQIPVIRLTPRADAEPRHPTTT